MSVIPTYKDSQFADGQSVALHPVTDREEDMRRLNTSRPGSERAGLVGDLAFDPEFLDYMAQRFNPAGDSLADGFFKHLARTVGIQYDILTREGRITGGVLHGDVGKERGIGLATALADLRAGSQAAVVKCEPCFEYGGAKLKSVLVTASVLLASLRYVSHAVPVVRDPPRVLVQATPGDFYRASLRNSGPPSLFTTALERYLREVKVVATCSELTLKSQLGFAPEGKARTCLEYTVRRQLLVCEKAMHVLFAPVRLPLAVRGALIGRYGLSGDVDIVVMLNCDGLVASSVGPIGDVWCNRSRLMAWVPAAPGQSMQVSADLCVSALRAVGLRAERRYGESGIDARARMALVGTQSADGQTLLGDLVMHTALGVPVWAGLVPYLKFNEGVADPGHMNYTISAADVEFTEHEVPWPRMSAVPGRFTPGLGAALCHVLSVSRPVDVAMYTDLLPRSEEDPGLQNILMPAAAIPAVFAAMPAGWFMTAIAVNSNFDGRLYAVSWTRSRRTLELLEDATSAGVVRVPVRVWCGNAERTQGRMVTLNRLVPGASVARAQVRVYMGEDGTLLVCNNRSVHLFAKDGGADALICGAAASLPTPALQWLSVWGRIGYEVLAGARALTSGAFCAPRPGAFIIPNTAGPLTRQGIHGSAGRASLRVEGGVSVPDARAWKRVSEWLRCAHDRVRQLGSIVSSEWNLLPPLWANNFEEGDGRVHLLLMSEGCFAACYSGLPTVSQAVAVIDWDCASQVHVNACVRGPLANGVTVVTRLGHAAPGATDEEVLAITPLHVLD